MIRTGVPRIQSATQCPRQAASIWLLPNASTAVTASPA